MSALRPFSSLDDVCSAYKHAGKHLPEMLPSCPRKACAAMLRNHIS